jgi:hypothetical protein
LNLVSAICSGKWSFLYFLLIFVRQLHTADQLVLLSVSRHYLLCFVPFDRQLPSRLFLRCGLHICHASALPRWLVLPCSRRRRDSMPCGFVLGSSRGCANGLL